MKSFLIALAISLVAGRPDHATMKRIYTARCRLPTLTVKQHFIMGYANVTGWYKACSPRVLSKFATTDGLFEIIDNKHYPFCPDDFVSEGLDCVEPCATSFLGENDNCKRAGDCPRGGTVTAEDECIMEYKRARYSRETGLES